MNDERIPSRALNDQRGILGLWVSDLFGAFGLFCIWARVFEDTPLALIGIPLAVASLVFLAPIRLSTRRKIIRDTISYSIRRFIGRTVVYDPRFSRIGRNYRNRKSSGF